MYMNVICAVLLVLVVTAIYWSCKMKRISLKGGNVMYVICAVLSASIVTAMWWKTAGYTIGLRYLFVAPLLLYSVSMLMFVVLIFDIIPDGVTQMAALGVVVYCFWIATFTAIGEVLMWIIRGRIGAF